MTTKTQYAKIRRERLMAQGLCSDCGKVKIRKNSKRKTCKSCRVKKREQVLFRHQSEQASPRIVLRPIRLEFGRATVRCGGGYRVMRKG